jgi:serine/threonine protein kinase
MRAEVGAEEQFGPYLVFERLGVGGMATVHRALERGIEGFERVVALKRLLPHLAADASFIKSFVREAKLASLLNHVNIVQIFECGRVGAQYFISMEYIDGRDIRRILRHARKVSGPPPVHVTVGLLLQLCEALDYAHGKTDDNGPLGLVHRDVSPSNVLVTSAGCVKVIDFGIAKAQSAQLRTQTGRVKGKLAYMAPEALSGKELDARSDLFAAGIIGHELLTARPLFATKNDYQTLNKIQRGDIVPPSTLNQNCPPELDAIVLRALARDPDERFTHASELRDELHAMRKQYNLQTSERDIAAWLDWAFGLEGPTDPDRDRLPRPPSKTELDVRPAPPERPSRLRRSDEEEAMEVAWGPAEDHDNGEPVMLDDVPDVTDKLLEASSLGAEVRLDLDDLADDIPTPVPSGPSGAGRAASEASQRAMAAALLARPGPRIKRPTPAMPLRNVLPIAAQAAAQEQQAASAPHGMQQTFAAPTADGSTRGGMPSLPRTVTLPPRILPSSTSSPATASAAAPAPGSTVRGRSPVPIPPRGIPSGSITPFNARGDVAALDGPADERWGAAGEPSRPRRGGTALGSSPRDALSVRGVGTTPPPTVAPARPRPRARSVTSPGTGPARPDTRTTGPTTLLTAETLQAGDAPTTEPTPSFALDELGLASDTIESMPAMSMLDTSPAEPIVRFREPSTPPPLSLPVQPSIAERSPPIGDGPSARPVPPATEVFAEPDPEPQPSAHDAPTNERDLRRRSGMAMPPIRSAPSQQGQRSWRGLWRMAAIFVALALVGAAVTAGALQLFRGHRAAVDPAPPPPAPPSSGKTVGTVELTVTPADSEITIEGKPMHVGTPWSIDLPPGVYQLEIHRDGYQGWLTSVELSAGEVHPLHIELDPLGANGVTDATMLITSTPPALEVLIDGSPAGKTPLKRELPPGEHLIVLRRNGAEVWRKTLKAQANQVHELRPVVASPADRAAGAPPPPSDPPPGPPSRAGEAPAQTPAAPPTTSTPPPATTLPPTVDPSPR